MGVGDGVSAIASLTMTFGGFSPTAMDGVAATREQLERMQTVRAEQKRAEERRRELERARASAPKRFTDDWGATWTYVVMDGSFVRIDGCKREPAHVVIPSSIEGLPVRALGSDVFHESEVVEEIICPDEVELIGACAFRLLANLRRVVLPARVQTFSGSWLQHCGALEELVLPGLLECLPPAVFDNPSLKRLHVGRALMGVKPGACERTQLEEFTVQVGNPFVYTDGDALYSIDGKSMIALVRPVAAYRVKDGCERIMKKCCMGMRALQHVELPDSLEVIEEYGFAHTGLVSAEVPPSVVTLKARSFFHCAQLRAIRLNEGLKVIEDDAFADSGLEGLRLPASIESIGTSVTAQSAVVHSGPGATFEVSPDSKSLYFDGEGGLYRRQDDGMHFIQLIDPDEETYAVIAGTTVVDEYAFAFHEGIREVTLPEGLTEIRRNAFRICRNLTRVAFPETLRVIGKEAFLDTKLESVYLPAGFEELADDALVTAGAHRLGEPPSLHEIAVHPDNPRYYVESGLLCRRHPEGDRAIVFDDATPDVVIPGSVTSIAPFALSNARNVRTFSVGPKLETIGTAGFSTWCYIENIHVELAEPLEGRSIFDLRFPDTPRAPHEIANSLGGSSWVNVPELYVHYDNCLSHAHDFNARESDGLSAYEQVRLMLERLRDPYLLTPYNKSVFERTIRDHLLEICVDVARHDDREVINQLFDQGALNQDNLEAVIDAVGRLQDAAMTGYLLEQKRVRYNRAAIDFDL